MKVFFDTNVYISEALVGKAAIQILTATEKASWRIYVNSYVLEEIEHVLLDYFGFSKRLATLTRERCRRRGIHVDQPISRHEVPNDPKDSPLLKAAITANVDYLVTNDKHLLELNPYEGLQIVSMTNYFELLVHQGLILETT